MTADQAGRSQSPPGGDSHWLMLREVDRLDRRVDQVETRLSQLDEHGSRGLTGLQVQLTELSKDMVALEATFSGFRRDLKAGRWTLAGAYVGGLLPLYVFIIQQLTK